MNQRFNSEKIKYNVPDTWLYTKNQVESLLTEYEQRKFDNHEDLLHSHEIINNYLDQNQNSINIGDREYLRNKTELIMNRKYQETQDNILEKLKGLKIDFFTKNKQGGCFYGLNKGVENDNQVIIKKYRTPDCEFTFYGILEDPKDTARFGSDDFTKFLCKYLDGMKNDNTKILERKIGEYIKKYVSYKYVKSKGSFAIQMNSNVFLISLNFQTPPIVVWEDEEKRFDRQHMGNISISSFSTDEIPLLDNYEVVLGNTIFWDDNYLKSFWRILSAEEDLSKLRHQKTSYDKIALCTRLVEKTVKKPKYSDQSVSIIYATFKSTKLID